MDGGEGEDTLSYESSDDWVRITLNAAGEDATASRGHASGDEPSNFENVRGSAFDDDLTGNGDANKLWGLAGDDDIDGAGDNDTIEGGAGADELDGGYNNGGNAGAANTEVNTLSYASSDAGVTVNLMTASASGGHAAGDVIETYEMLAPTDDDPENEIDVATFVNVTGSDHNDRLTGDDQDNQLEGGAGDDTLRGGASQRGNGSTALILRGDVLVGGPGADVLDGGEDMREKDDMIPGTDLNNDGDFDDTDEVAPVMASVDWVVYKHAMEGISVDLSTNRGTGGEAMGDQLINIELVWGSEHADTFIAGSGPDTIEGDGGSDTVSYEASSLGVTVNLGTGTQHRTVTADVTDPENPVFHADDGESGRLTPDTVARPTAGVPRLDANGAEFDTDNVEDEDDNPNANGAAGDRLGSIENLTGSDHDDSLTGDANPNVLKGMGGDDTLVGAAGNDKLYGGAGDDTLSSTGGANEFDGGAGDDTITGGSDADKITGGTGDDILDGGTGADTFVFSPADGRYSDIITGFDATTDKIDLSAFDLTAEQVASAIDTRGSSVLINLEAHGGGRITLQATDATTAGTLLEALDTATSDDNTDGVVDSLSQRIDLDGDGDFTGTGEADGVFIL